LENLLNLRSWLLRSMEQAVDDCSAGAPTGFVEILRKCVRSTAGTVEPSLLACASSAWCGATAEAGMPVAVAAQILRSAISAHASLPGFDLEPHVHPLWKDHGQASAILAGDALIPLAFLHLARACGAHSSLLVQDAALALGGGGLLAGLSLELDLADGSVGRPLPPSGVFRLHGGRLAQFAASGGARLAGAPREMLDDAALAGYKTGLALDMLTRDSTGPGQTISRTASAEASTILDDALSIIGSGPEGELFRRIIDAVWDHSGNRDHDDSAETSGDLFDG
jgi:hypothetical protein